MREQIIARAKALIRPVARHRFLLERAKYRGETILSGQDGNDRIAEMINRSGAAGKIGATEIKLARVYLRRRDSNDLSQNFGHYAWWALEYPDWFAGLAALKEQLDARPFDVAIIGAGAWSVPLAVHAKSLGAFGIYLGGATQLLFGIMGGRWDANAEIGAFVNDAWTRPSDDERPRNFRLHENGSYW